MRIFSKYIYLLYIYSSCYEILINCYGHARKGFCDPSARGLRFYMRISTPLLDPGYHLGPEYLSKWIKQAKTRLSYLLFLTEFLWPTPYSIIRSWISPMVRVLVKIDNLITALGSLSASNTTHNYKIIYSREKRSRYLKIKSNYYTLNPISKHFFHEVWIRIIDNTILVLNI